MDKQLLNDPEWLRTKYYGDKLDTKDIAGIIGCCDWTIRSYMDKFGIARRSKSEAFKLDYARTPERREGAAQRMIERYSDPKVREEHSRLMKEHYADPKVREAMSKKLKEYFIKHPERREAVSKQMIKRYSDPKAREAVSIRMKAHHIKHPEHREAISKSSKELWKDADYRYRVTKSKSESTSKQWEVPEYREAHTGSNHHNWKGGISFEPYTSEFNETFKENVRELYNRKCFLCDGLSSNGNKLDVHHIDYDKTNTRIENCVALCNSCHIVTNFYREDWQMFLEEEWLDFLFIESSKL